MATITLLSVTQAKPGFVMDYIGAAPPCGPCKFRNACLTLDSGHRYSIITVRKVKHSCALQETDAAVVDVEPVARPLVVDAQGAVDGATIEVSRYPCSIMKCPHWDDCAGPTLGKGNRFTIVGVTEEKVCLAGRRIKVVSAR